MPSRHPELAIRDRAIVGDNEIREKILQKNVFSHHFYINNRVPVFPPARMVTPPAEMVTPPGDMVTPPGDMVTPPRDMVAPLGDTVTSLEPYDRMIYRIGS